MKYSFSKFLWKEHKKELLIASFVLLILVIVFGLRSKPGMLDYYSDILNPIIGFSTMTAALLIWWSERRREWQNDFLPKKINVFFNLKGKPVMQWYESNLLSEADLRAWSQQLGAQMAGSRNLDIYTFTQLPIEIKKGTEGKLCKFYTVEIELASLPKLDKDNNSFYKKFESNYRYRAWNNGELIDEWRPRNPV
jgi:hypothetical protein